MREREREREVRERWIKFLAKLIILVHTRRSMFEVVLAETIVTPIVA